MDINNESRKNIIKTLSEVLNEKLAKQVEESIFNFIKVYIESSDIPSFLAQSMYEDKSNNIINEITDKDSNYILDAINKNKIKGGISNIAFLKPEELNPDRYKKIIDKKEMEEYKKNNKVGSTAYTCSKCKKKNTLVTQKQTRAGDEPPTIFVECLECGNKWTES